MFYSFPKANELVHITYRFLHQPSEVTAVKLAVTDSVTDRDTGVADSDLIPRCVSGYPDEFHREPRHAPAPDQGHPAEGLQGDHRRADEVSQMTSQDREVTPLGERRLHCDADVKCRVV